MPIINIKVTDTQKQILENIYGPRGQVGPNILMVLLDPKSHKNPDLAKRCLQVYGQVFGLLVREFSKPGSCELETLCMRLQTLKAATEMLRILQENAP